LLLITERACRGPAINELVFPNLYSESLTLVHAGYWSSTPNSENPDWAYLVNFHDGEVNRGGQKVDLYGMRLVRDPL
jgi:hypothetical protein